MIVQKGDKTLYKARGGKMVLLKIYAQKFATFILKDVTLHPNILF